MCHDCVAFPRPEERESRILVMTRFSIEPRKRQIEYKQTKTCIEALKMHVLAGQMAQMQMKTVTLTLVLKHLSSLESEPERDLRILAWPKRHKSVAKK